MQAPVVPRSDIRRLPREVVMAFVDHAEEYLLASPGKQWALAFMAGSFIGFGAMLSIVITVGVTPEGVSKLLLGVGFTAGFTMVILSGAALFTEVNVLLPELFLSGMRSPGRLLRFWLIVYLGNAAGAAFLGAGLNAAEAIDPGQADRLTEIIALKMRFADTGVDGWFQAVASGILANWLVGMAAFLATAARTVSSKIVGIFFPIVTFVALGVQHAPANMGYFAAGLIHGHVGTDFGEALVWNIAPATVGNLIGGAIFVALLFWYTFGSDPKRRDELRHAEGLVRLPRNSGH
jgi:formate transporter